MKPFTLALMAAISATCTGASSPVTDQWSRIRWRGESAFILTTARWKAIVSVERGRLVHFGPAGSSESYVFAPEKRDAPIGWGGHRVWLGPQIAWTVIWPPPGAWETSRAREVRVAGAVLELDMPASGGGWPRLTRVYALSAGRLACRIRVAADGARDGQIIQILQVPTPHDLTVPPTVADGFPEGFALVPPIDGRRTAQRAAPLPGNVTATDTGLRLRQTERPEKLGFLPCELVARFASGALHVGYGEVVGTTVGAPDAGFHTQIYLGEASTPVIELEQLSPLLKAGEAAEFTMWLDVSPAVSPASAPPAADRDPLHLRE